MGINFDETREDTDEGTVGIGPNVPGIIFEVDNVVN